MSRKAIYGVVVGAGFALAFAAAWWLQQPKSPGTETPAAVSGAGGPGASARGPGGPGALPSVEVAPVTVTRLVEDAQSVGSLRSRQSVLLRPEVSGRIVHIGFEDGARVRKGQLLFQLDDTLQRAELSQAQAQLSIAQVNLKRNEELVAQNFVARRVLDESRASLQVAEAQVQLAEARVARMRIVAPFDGVVGICSVSLGDFVREGAELVNLEDLSQLYVDFRLPERYQARVGPGQTVQVQIDALPGQNFTARVQAVDPLVDANGRALQVRAVMSSADHHSLRPGLFARVTVVLSVQEAALMVPEEAIVPQGGRQVVYVLGQEGEGDGARPVARRAEVTLGLRRSGMVEVLSGVQAGDSVVVAGQQRLQRDGMPVRVIDMSRPSGPPAGAAAQSAPHSLG
nr:efflux RND transporter periplasmic adaptor subunit [Tepidicella baoligensis]